LAIDPASYYERYGPMVLRRCRALLGDEELATDCMQDTFVRLLVAGDRLQDEAPSSLLYRMATNVCLNRLRSQRRKPLPPDMDTIDRVAALTPDPEARSGARRLLDRLFGREQPSTASIAVMHLHDGMTLEEVAAAVGMSVSGVRKRLRVLRARLEAMEGA